MSNTTQSQKQLREVTDLLNSYQQKIAIYNEEIDLLKSQLVGKDKELDQMRIQLKNLKRSRSSDSNYDRNRRQMTFSNSTASKPNENNKLNTNEENSADLNKTSNKDNQNMDRKQRSMSVDTSETLSRQVEIANDEIRLLRNKISRLEDDLLIVTQERDNLTSQLDKIEDKAMKSFTTITENDTDTDLDIDSVVIKQMNELKKKIDHLNVEAKQNEDTKNQLSGEIKQLKEQLNEKFLSSGKAESLKSISTEKLNAKVIEFEDKEKLKENEEVEKEDSKNDDTILKRDDNEIETIKNLTDADKLLRDEYKLLKLDLDDKNEIISKMQNELQQNFSFINEIKKMLEIKEANLNESVKKEKLLNENLEETNKKLELYNQKVEECEASFKKFKTDLEFKESIEKELRIDNQKLDVKLRDVAVQLQEKLSEIEFLNRENNALQERINTDENKLKLIDKEKIELKSQIDELKKDLDTKSRELYRCDKLIKTKEIELNETNLRITNKELSVKEKLEEYEKNKKELISLQAKYTELSSTLGDKVNSLNKEIDRLNKDKEKLQLDLADIKGKHTNCVMSSKDAKSLAIESEIDHEKAVLEKLENQALNAKYETKIQYLEVEIDTLRSKIRKLLREKEVQDQVLKENQQLVKEIALKYASDSDSWNRQRQKLLEKEKLYEESVDMRKELKKAADKLRQKLQSLEEQIIDKQNKHTIEKNNWETQRIIYMQTNNKLEEQLSKLSTLKRSKKEIEFAWDKERRELNGHIQNLEVFIKDLQAQLSQRNSSAVQINDQYGQNEKIQSLSGENDFLKNRIRELEIMLDEMDQVKRFLFDVKEAYDTDRHEWIMAKEEFRNQLEIKESLWIDCSMRLNEIVNVIRAIQSNEPLPANVISLSARSDSIDQKEEHKNETLNNLVGGTSNILDFKFGAKPQISTPVRSPNPNFFYQQSEQMSPSKLNLTNLKPIDELNQTLSNEHDDLQLIDVTKDRKELETEFEQAFKKMDRVKDNFGTHKKFMDIVKSKSMKALNRKSSTTSLPMNDGYAHESRASVPPDMLTTSSSSNQRAKSTSKEPGSRESSQKPGSSHSSLFAPSRFFSLSRRIAKIRFSSSSQPPPPVKSPLASEERGFSDTSLKPDQKSKSQLLVPDQEPTLTDDEKTPKKSFRDRALSPSRIFRSLRPRSPFSKSNRNSKTNTTNPANQSATTMISGTTGAISGKNKSFTVAINNPTPSDSSPTIQKSHFNRNLMSASYQSASVSSSNIDETTPSISSNVSQNSYANRFVRATTAAPSLAERSSSLNQSLQNDKLKSLSCEFIDSPGTSNLRANTALKQLSETLNENDELNGDNNSNVTNASAASYTVNPALPEKDRRLLTGGFSALGHSSKVDTLRKNFMEQGSGQSHEIVKSVKFKEPEKGSPSKSDIYKESLNDLNESKEDDKLGILGNFKKLNVKFDDNNSKSYNSSNQRMKNSFSTSNVDKPPKAPNVLPTSNTSTLGTFSLRNKFYGGKSRTIDFPENSNEQSSNVSPSNQLKSSNSITSSINNNLLTPSGRPIQSILRRSETPTKSGLRQPSIESHDSTRETSIEKLLKNSSSTSRPLMFNN